MDHQESVELRRFREEVREWLHANKPKEARPSEDSFADRYLDRAASGANSGAAPQPRGRLQGKRPNPVGIEMRLNLGQNRNAAVSFDPQAMVDQGQRTR